jgi:hypothetical protein
VPRAALVDLLDASGLDWSRWVDLDVACAEARRFKLDVSFQLGARPATRLSVNDKGEPDALRRRLPMPAFYAISPPGEVQTTLGIKPGRRSLYYEELAGHPRAEVIHREVLALARVEAAWEGLPNAVCVDLDEAGAVVGAKDYHLRIDADPTGPFPLHPVTGLRRRMYARRFAPGGRLVGVKELWVAEVHRPEQVDWAWAQVDRLVVELAVDDTPLRHLRAGWRHAPGVYLHPDLLCVNRDAAGEPEGLLVYVSVR